MKRILILVVLVLAFSASVCGAYDDVESDPVLLFQYHRLNAMYFDGKLPTDNVIVAWDNMVVRKSDLEIQKKEVAGTWITHYAGEPLTIKMKVTPSIRFCEPCVKLAVLEEMVRVLLYDRKVADLHGKEFQKEMANLAQKGVFADIW